MITAKSRLFRAMKGINRLQFHEAGNADDYFATYSYEDNVIKFSEDGFYMVNQEIKIKYIEITNAACFIDDKPVLDGVVLTLNNGKILKIKISGRDGNFYDAHSLLRFLNNTAADKKFSDQGCPWQARFE